AYDRTNDARAGLDSKIVMHGALALDLTLNPDFGQVESDQPQVTVNRRYAVFYPEKRPFFLENAGFFATSEQLFYSRRIVDPQFGVRLTGKSGPWAVGALVSDDRAEGRSIAAGSPLFGRHAVASVARIQREIGKETFVGVTGTDREFS